MDPQYYPEFQYASQGVVKDLLQKKKTEFALRQKLDAVLEKYKQFESPYFVNYTHVTSQGEAEDLDRLNLFHFVLVRLGFDELQEFPSLTGKLVWSTRFRFGYESFVERTKVHLRNDLESTLRSWIDERGSAFRQDLPMFLYWLWVNQLLLGVVAFNAHGNVELVSDAEYRRVYELCEAIYLDIRIERFRILLEDFDSALFVTIYDVDAMGGYEFEDFLASVFTALGFDIQTTKRSADQGADLFAERFGRKIVVQAKNYSDSVGNAAVQQVLAAKTFFNCDDAMVVTNNYFTPSARQLADAGGVKLVDRRELQQYLDEYNQTLMDRSQREREGSEPLPPVSTDA
ncbi:MAG TPA: restriction endonuclease [Gaiellaceae bacterium]|nr:restriction endonuclease [Gaiellaceae bacterium]